MTTKYILLAVFLQCLISGTENTEIFNKFTEKLSKYSIVNPQVIHRTTRSINKPQKIKEESEDEVSYALNINNRKHLLHLKKNQDFLHANFFAYWRDASGKSNSSFERQHVHCYYHGEVEGYDNSLVALSTCSGLRGVIVFGNETFGLEPVPRSASNDHLLYLLEDVLSEPATCGVVDEATTTASHERFEPGQSLTSLLRKKRNLPQTSYVELVLVVDNLRYNLKNKNATAVRDEMVEMANLLDGYYKLLNIRIMLVGLEIFKDSNPFSVEGSAGSVLGSFVKWRKSTLLPKIRHDVAQLIVGRSSYGGVLGMAYVGTVCSVTTSGGINVFNDDRLAFVSTVVAHEMGHNMGMKHDNTRCKCGDGSCIMAASAGGSSTFSTCSADDFERLVLRGGGGCLRNPPSPSDVIGTAECGNGRVDEGEQCDCGKPEECKNKCCDAATCKFTKGSVCADGACCKNCQIEVSGTPCRKSVNSCDLPEYCLGNSSFCPEDFYIMDGLPCENGAAYCYEGRCQTYDYQCRDIFSPDPARKADDICFRHANTVGDRFGNCGFNNGAYIKCSTANAKCGKLQCTDVDANNPPAGATITNTVVEGKNCVNADFRLGPDVLDPAYSNPGSPCAEGKTCLDFQCVNASALLPDLNCKAETTCRGQGVCNDQGNCHCNNGWAPPFCATSGRGGSINSGPAMIDHSLRNGLLIFFLLVVPVVVLVILALLYVFRRDVFDPCKNRGIKSRNAQNKSTNPGSNSENQTHATVNFQGDATPDVLPGNPPTAAPFSRYGEQDYWKPDIQEPPPRPPARVQGPGVPKPIPPKQPPV